MKITTIPSVKYIDEDVIRNKCVVIIDVLRATSVITTAIANGAQEVLAVKEIDEALQLKDENSLLGGERKALKIEGFDLSNSPLEYSKKAVGNKKVVLTTTNGTNAIARASMGGTVLIGCMQNGKAVARRVAMENRDTVILCAGTYGKFSIDDFICAGKILYEILELSKAEMDDLSAAAYMAYRDNKGRTIEYIKKAAHYKYLVSIGLEEDIEYCFMEDQTETVPEYINGKIINSLA